MDSFANSVKKPPLVTYPTAMAPTCEELVHGLEDMQGGAKSGTYEGSHGFPSCPELVDHCNDSLRETIGRTGRRRALQHFHLNHIAGAMCNRYRALGNELHWNGAE
jgi:hypothetical protein